MGRTTVTLACLALVVLSTAAGDAARAQDAYPSKPIRFVLPQPAGRAVCLVASSKVEANSVQELIALAKANPGKLNYASIGLGTQAHLGMELFKLMTKTDIAMVSYRGTAPAMTDLAAGVVDVMFTGPPSAMALAAGGKGKILAIASPSRSRLMPQVPTRQEAGVPGSELSGWFGLVAPAKTTQHVVDPPA